MLVLLFILFSLCPVRFQTEGGDIFLLSRGYSFLWIAVLYVAGAVIRKFELHTRKSVLLGIAIISVLITWYWKAYGSVALLNSTGIEIPDGVLVSYISPTIVIVAVALFLLIANLHMGNCLARTMENTSYGICGCIIHLYPMFGN